MRDQNEQNDDQAAAGEALVDVLYRLYTDAPTIEAVGESLAAAPAWVVEGIDDTLAAAVAATSLALTSDLRPATADEVEALAPWARLVAAAALLMMPPGRSCCLYPSILQALEYGEVLAAPGMQVPIGNKNGSLDWVYRGGYVPADFAGYDHVTISCDGGGDEAAVLAAVEATPRLGYLALSDFVGVVSMAAGVDTLVLARCRLGEVAAPRAKLVLDSVEGCAPLLRAAFDAGLEIAITSSRIDLLAVEVRGAVPRLDLVGDLLVSGACRADRLALSGCELAPNARLTAGRAQIGWFGGGGVVTAGRVDFTDRAGGNWATLAAPGAAAPAGGWPAGRPRIVSGVFTGLRETSAVVGRLASASYYVVVNGLARDSPRVESDEVVFCGRAAPGAARGRPTTVSSLRDANDAGAAVVRARCLQGGRAGDYATLVLSFVRAGWHGVPAGDVRVGLLVVRVNGQDMADAVAGLRDLPNGRRVMAERVMLVDLAGRRVDGAALAAAVGGRPVDEAPGVPAGWLTDDIVF